MNTINNSAIKCYIYAHQPTRIKSKPSSLSIYIIKNILSSRMQKSFLHHYEHPMLYLCTYYPVCNYVAPFSYAQQGSMTNFNSNFVGLQQKTELSTNASIEALAPIVSTKMSKGSPIVVIKRNKRRHHRNKSKLIQSAKKNCESNLINHILTFLTKQKECLSILNRAISHLGKSKEQSGKIRQHFQEVLRFVNLKRQRKYINRKNILCFFTSNSLKKQLSHLAQKFEKSTSINLDELCYLYRVCIMYYLRNVSPIGILTSKRIENLAKKIHLKRRTFLLNEFLKKDSGSQPMSSEE